MEMFTNLEGWKKNKLRGETKRNKEEREKKRYKQEGGEAVEILINGQWILTPANSEGDFDVKGPKDSSKICMSPNDNTEFNIDLCNSFEIPSCLNSRISSPVLSQSSSLESLLALGIELFPSKERLHRSISLESCLNKCHSPDIEVVGSLASLGELNQGQEINSDRVKPSEGINSGTETSSGDLSQRTLDLLKRLENIQNPLLVKMKCSVSDKSIQSSQFLVSPSLGGQHTPLSEIFSTSWKEQPPHINETLSKVSLTELSSTEDSSMESENFVILRNQHHICLDPNMAANASSRPLHLRKGDFYSYLSLSSHDSDCGEVSQCAEDKSSTPVPYSIPSYFTSTQALNRPSPELFPGTKQPTSIFQSAQLTKCSSPNLTTKNNIGCLDLKCFDSDTTSVTDGSQAEQCSSPSLSVPPSPDIRNEETLFEACTEEVYLGPPLCYSIVIKKKPQPFQQKLCLDTSLASGSELNKNAPSLSLEGPNSELDNRLTDHFFSKQGCGSFLVSPVPEPRYSSFSTSPLLGSNSSSSDDNLFSPLPVSTGAKEKQLSEDLYLSSDGIVGKVATPVSVSMPQEKRSSNEGPSYLNPWVRVALIESFATKCLADTKMLESNMGTVMTKISVCSSATNPLKDPATAATRINPKISCSAIRKPDREEGKTGKESDTQWTEEKEKRRKGWSSSQQEAKSTMMKPVSIPCICAISRHYTVLRHWTPILCFGDYF
ncbi:hypothetical protein GOODEAATRI_015264 [Goodea atripinnis]|uniref:Uncharacterized protein n=1 Tax=Goodea atripinnis TaxID=208336 RepID=A0ABV0N3S0_9TELE